MNRNDWRASRDGKCVADWDRPRLYIEKAFKYLKNRIEHFLERHPEYRAKCDMVGDRPPKILIEIWRSNPESASRPALTDVDGKIIMSFILALSMDKRNLTFDQTSFSPFGPLFEFKIKTYYPYMERQPELDLFVPFAGNASQPDPNHYKRKHQRTSCIDWEDPEDLESTEIS